MTTIDMTGASEAEFRARVAAFDAAPTPPEVAVETVARAILYAVLGDTDGGLVLDGDLPAAEIARLIAQYGAAAAIAALPPSPAEEAVKAARRWIEEADSALRSATVIRERMQRTGQVEGLNLGNHDRLVNSSQAVRAALASPAPAQRDRYAQCDDTCTADCGACKGAGPS